VGVSFVPTARIEFEAYWDGESWCARAREHSIYTFADSLDELLKNVKEAAQLYVEEEKGFQGQVEIVLRVQDHVPEVAASSG